MLFTMGITLYTSRVILNTLGIVDYGIYNVVGGFVMIFAVLSNSLSSAISRFITFELGKGNIEKLKTIFTTAINIQLSMSVIVVIVCEIIGVWFLNTKMTIPSDRLLAANWVLQFCTISFCLSLIRVPYNATVIAHERMDAFAYISILEVSLKLIIVYMLSVSPFDKLITYALLLIVVNILLQITYILFCRRSFEECIYRTVIDKPILKEMSSFAGWNFFGNLSYIVNTQGINILINIYFGVAVNAASGISAQVDNAARLFVNSFTTAVNPQITKSYAIGDYKYMNNLICQSAKFSSFLMLIFAIPIILEANTILHVWLEIVPKYATIFVQLAILNTFLDSIFCNGIITAVLATGRIKRYQLIMTACGIIVFPISWLLFEIGLPPQTSYFIFMIDFFIQIIVRMYLVKDLIYLDPRDFMKKVFCYFIPVALISLVPSIIIIKIMEEGLLRLVLVCIISIPFTVMIEYFVGLSKTEKIFVKNKITQRINIKH